MYCGFNSFEEKTEVVATICPYSATLELLTETGRFDINLAQKDLPWLEELVSEAQKIISFYKKEDPTVK
jgi:hypothetical protein